MRDRDIRAALHSRLREEHDGDATTLIVDELGLCQGSVRADVAVVNGSLAGFEIKSDRDTLARLPRQIEVYNRVFDYVTLIVGPKHATGIRNAIPRGWGVVQADGNSDAVGLRVLRPARRNTKIEPLAVARLLWRDEALMLLARRGLDRGMQSKPRRDLWAALVAAVPGEELAASVREALRSRADWRSGRPPSRDGGLSRSSATSSHSRVR